MIPLWVFFLLEVVAVLFLFRAAGARSMHVQCWRHIKNQSVYHPQGQQRWILVFRTHTPCLQQAQPGALRHDA